MSERLYSHYCIYDILICSKKSIFIYSIMGEGEIGFIKKNKKKILIVSSIVVLGIIILFVFGRNNVETLYARVDVEDFQNQTFTTGVVESRKNIDASFDINGTVSAVYVDVGDEFSRGDVLAVLDTRDLRSDIAIQESETNIQRISLRKIISGLTEEEREAVMRDVSVSEQNVANEVRIAVNTLLDAFNKVENVIFTKIDLFFQNPTSIRPQVLDTFSFSKKDENIAVNHRIAFGRLLSLWRENRLSVSDVDDYEKIRGAVEQRKNEVYGMYVALDDIISIAQESYEDGGMTQAQFDLLIGVRESLFDIHTSLVVQLNALEERRKVFLQKQADAQRQLGDARQEDIDIAFEELETQQNRLDVLKRDAREKATIIAPFSGKVAEVSIRAGENVDARESALRLISNDPEDFYIQAEVSEIDIKFVAVGEKVVSFFPALNANIPFVIVSISGVAKDNSGVAVYDIELEPDEGVDTSMLREGLSVDLNIDTEFFDAIFVVPSSALSKVAGKSFVEVLQNEEKGVVEKREVEVGITTSSGKVQVNGNIREGDSVVVTDIKDIVLDDDDSGGRGIIDNDRPRPGSGRR